MADLIANAADIPARFSGVARLYGRSGLARLQAAHICVVGLGGVGSWAVESLARTGVGRLTLVDLDDVCLSNVNRQIHGLSSLVGVTKAQALAQRIADINPDCQVIVREQFFTQATADGLLEPAPDGLIDAIDSLKHKCELIAQCRQRGIRLVTVGGAGGRRDAAQIQVDDLTRTRDDPLLALTRKKLRQEYDFPRHRRMKWKIDSVFSQEPPVYPTAEGEVSCEREPGSELRLNCDAGYGTACHVTATFGMMAAGRLIERLLQSNS